MISFLIGEIAEVRENLVSIDVAGVGYRVNAPTSVTGSVCAGDSGITIHTTLISSDNRMELYGFMSPEERDIFELLITVSGIGPKAGIKLMSLQKERLVEAIASEDIAMITTIPGIGPKTAKRLVLELKDKISELFKDIPGVSAAVLIPTEGEAETAVRGLQALGYSGAEIRNMIRNIPQEDLKTLSASEIIRLCLQRKE